MNRSAPSVPQPFPFAGLPAISRDELRAAARLRAAAARYVRAEAVAAALGELTGEAVSVHVRRTRTLGTAAPSDGVAVAFAPAEDGSLARAAVVDVEHTLAALLVARALRQRTPRVIDTSKPASPALAGAVAALLHAALRRAHAGAPLRVVAAGPAAMLARDFAALHGATVTAWLTVVVAGDAFDARVSLPDAMLGDPAPLELGHAALAALGEMPIALPVVVATCLADRTTLAALRPGDAFVIPGCALAVSGVQLSGQVALVPSTAERGLAAHLGDDGRLVLGSAPLESHPWDRPLGEAMTGENPTLQVVEEAPVVVRVELGAVEMSARAWASLAPGDVVTLGRKLGDPAILRVAGVEVARGELVQVDGEYGVRILGRGAGEGRG